MRLPKPGRPRHVPVWPHPEIRTTISPGLLASRSSGARPILSRVPGLKFSTRTSAEAMSSRATTRPSALRMSTARLCLLRQYAFQKVDTPSTRQALRSSPRPGFSILITSAPKSASTWVSTLPATSRDMSMTLRPSSGAPAFCPVMSLSSGCCDDTLPCPAQTRDDARYKNLIWKADGYSKTAQFCNRGQAGVDLVHGKGDAVGAACREPAHQGGGNRVRRAALRAQAQGRHPD